MKKKILFVVLFVIVLIGAGFNFFKSNYGGSLLNDLTLKNIEALATPENPFLDCVYNCTFNYYYNCVLVYPDIVKEHVCESAYSSRAW